MTQIRIGGIRLSPRIALLLTTNLLSSIAVGASTWVIEGVDCPKQFGGMTDRSLRLDADGNPHIAYGEDHLYYAWHDGSGWHLETADGSYLVGAHAALDIDAEGYPHISYYDAAEHDLKYAYKDVAGWHCETVDSQGDIGEYTSVALDGSGHPHITYYDDSNRDLKYAHHDGSHWHVELVDSAGSTGSYGSVSIDANGEPHVGYRSGNETGYAYRDAGGWHVESPAIPCHGHVSLALDTDDQPRLAFYHQGNLKYAYTDSAGWHAQTVASGGGYCSVGKYASLALDDEGSPHIAYHYYSGGYYYAEDNVGYAHRTATGSWTTSYVCGGWGWVSLAIDGDQRPHVSCLGAGLTYATEDGGMWDVEVVDTEGDNGRYVSLAAAHDGSLHLSYRDGHNLHEVYHAWEDSLGWHRQTVDSAGTYWTSLALDDSCQPHLAYNTGEEVTYAHRDGSGWHFETVDEGGWAALALDDQCWPHIAYSSGSTLKYAQKDGGSWVTEDVTQESLTGVALDVDASGAPHISYCNHWPVPPKIKYAAKRCSTWVIEVADESGYIGTATSIRVDASGGVHIATNDSYGWFSWRSKAKYAHRNGAGWIVEIVDGPFDDGQSVSLALDAEGCPHIAYNAQYQYDYMLKYARKVGPSWQIETVDDRGWHMGEWCSLALDPEGRTHIAYYDDTLGDLWHASAVHEVPADDASPEPAVPGTVRLHSVAPNPASAGTSILYSLGDAANGGVRSVTLKVYDCAGRCVAMPLEEEVLPGSYSTTWDLRGRDGRRVPAGLHVVRLEVGSPNTHASARLVVVR
jgi:hypothetical protein